MQRTMVGVAPPGEAPPAAPRAPVVAPRSAPASPTLPSDFPAALGLLGEPPARDALATPPAGMNMVDARARPRPDDDFGDIGLPVVSGADLPAAKRAPAKPAAARPAAPPVTRPAIPTAKAPAKAPATPKDEASFADLDLPAVRADLPATKGGPAMRPAARPEPPPQPRPATPAPDLAADADLPAVLADLPARPDARRPAAAAAPPAPDADLPVVAAGLPAVAAGLPAATVRRPPGAPTPAPAVARAAPAAGRPAAPAPAAPGPFDLDLPVVAAADLPAVAAGLPAVAAGLPAVAAGLPAVAAGLPMVAAGLPAPVEKGFGEIDLPSVADILPVVHPTASAAQSPEAPAAAPAARPAGGGDMFGDFGELDLPGEAPRAAAPAPPARDPGFAGFGDLDFEANPEPSRRRAPAAQRPEAPAPAAASHDPHGARAAGGLAFGELDLGGEPLPELGGLGQHPLDTSADPGGPIREALGGGAFGELDDPLGAAPSAAAREQPDAFGEAPIPTTSGRPSQADALAPPPALGAAGGFEAALPVGAGERLRPRGGPPKRKSARGKRIALGLGLLAVLGGAALQLTPYGAFGHLAILDAVRAGDYAKATAGALSSAQASLAGDTYDGAKAAEEEVGAAHAKSPRARPLTALAALVDFSVSVRFGSDPARAGSGKRWLTELAPNADVKYLPAALAAESAAREDWEKARKGLEAASRKDEKDPVQREIALLRGEVELGAKDGAAAIQAFNRAADLGGEARARYGLARGYALVGDRESALKQVEATLQASPNHPGAILLRASYGLGYEAKEEQSLKDATTVLDGAARPKASPQDLATAHAVRGWVQLERGATSEARAAFDEALKLGPRNVLALRGQGELLMREARYTEALTRFDAALQADAASPATVASDAEAKLKLERLQEAKTQLVAAQKAFPKDVRVATLLGRVEQSLGNLPAAEKQLRDAVKLVDVSRRDAVSPYVWLATLLTVQSRANEGQLVLDEAKQRLPESPALIRAFGQVAEAQGKHDVAAIHYRKVVEKDPKDLATRFRLGVELRRAGKLDEAGAEFDRVEQTDKDFPGLALERGILFEKAGDIQKAIEQFKNALAKAPDDPDLQLRVGAAYVTIFRPEEALPMLKKVLEKRPNSAEAHHYIGRAHMLAHSDAEAIKNLIRAVELDPNRAEFHLYVAWAANDALQPQLSLAKTHVDKALTLDASLAEGYWQRGVVERRLGAVKDARADLDKALTLNPRRYEIHAALAELFEDTSDVGAALGAWGRAVADEDRALGAAAPTRHPEWRYRYGRLLLDKGNAGEALRQLQRSALVADALEPRPAWVAPMNFHYAEALRKAGRKPEAIERYQKFMRLSPTSSPDRGPAMAALAQLGQPYR